MIKVFKKVKQSMRTERILVRPADENYQAMRNACRLAKSVFNTANYRIRQAFINHSEIISHSTVDKELKSSDNDCYKGMPSAASAQRVIQVLGKDWKSFFAAIKDWKRAPEKYKSRPKLPNYAKHQKTFVVGRNGFKIVNGYVHLSGSNIIELKPFKIMCCKNQPFNEKAELSVVQDIRFVPKGNCYFIEVVYKPKSLKNAVALNKSNVLGIDLGIDNLATITSNQQGIRPVLINGKVIKSINNKYNKDKAELQSKGKGKHILSKSIKRYNWVNDHLHKVSRYIIDMCLKTDSGVIVIGKNKDWKQSINIGRINNQKFVSIPHAELINKIQYKAAEYGIEVIVREESYTSKASAMDLDYIPTHGNGDKKAFSGSRVKRGLYKASNGKLLNADVNGCLNIIRKEFGNDFIRDLFDSGCVFQPMRVTC